MLQIQFARTKPDFSVDSLAQVIRGRPVKSTVDASTLERVLQVINECDQGHDGCRLHDDGDFVPRQFLDLHYSKSKSDKIVTLVELGSESRQKYAALSYASSSGIVSSWGTNESNEIRVSSLPKLFQDAIDISCTLNMRYLWIDSLCIPRGETEWQPSSHEAGSVYANAYLTISATGAADLFEGLLFPRPEPKSVQIHYETNNDVVGTVLATNLPLAKEVIRSRYMEMQNEPISRGVWSFQDRVLSKRTVHFASDQIYIECMQQFVSEDGLLERLRYHTTIEELPPGTRDYRPRAMNQSHKSRWFAIVEDYVKREPVLPADRLPALANIARAFQRLAGSGRDEYIAGHWKDYLVESLCWQSLACKPARDTEAPSWSWVSVEGIIRMGLECSRSHHCLATVDSTLVTLVDDSDPFGQITSASILLRAPRVIPLRLVEESDVKRNTSGFGQVRLRSESGTEGGIFVRFDTIDKRFSVSAETLRDQQLFALVLAKTSRNGESLGVCDAQGILHGLIVAPDTRPGDNGLRRLGFFMADQDDLGPSSLLETYEAIKLV